MENSDEKKDVSPEVAKVTEEPKQDTTTVDVKEKPAETTQASDKSSKKNNKILALVIALFVFLLLCCCCSFFGSSLLGDFATGFQQGFTEEYEKSLNENGVYPTKDLFGNTENLTTYSIGEAAENGDLSIKVVNVEDPFLYTGEFYKTEAGNKLVAVEVELTNISDTLESVSPYYFKVKDQDNYEYDYQYGTVKEPVLSSGTLNPDESVKGWVTFSVPEDTTQLLLTNEDFLSNSKIEIELN